MLKHIQKFKIFTTLIVAPLAGQLFAQEAAEKAPHRDGWYTDLEEAKKVALKEGKDLLIEFTRSEGCGWCLKLEKEVLSQPEFLEQIPQKYVMVILNYPRDESQWSAEVKQQHEAARKYYKISKFPCLVFTEANGRPYVGKSYRDKKAKEYLKKLGEVSERRNKRDDAFSKAKQTEGEVKARLLEKGLSEVSRKYRRHYPEVIAAIAKADPSDASGFVTKIRIDEVKSGMEKLLGNMYDERKFDAIPAIVDGYIREHNPKGEALQVAMLYKVQALYMAEHYEPAQAVADEVIGINDSSRAARYAKTLKKRIEHINEK